VRALIAGVAHDLTGSYRAGFVLAIVFLVIAALPFWRVLPLWAFLPAGCSGFPASRGRR